MFRSAIALSVLLLSVPPAFAERRLTPGDALAPGHMELTLSGATTSRSLVTGGDSQRARLETGRLSLGAWVLPETFLALSLPYYLGGDDSAPDGSGPGDLGVHARGGHRLGAWSLGAQASASIPTATMPIGLERDELEIAPFAEYGFAHRVYIQPYGVRRAGPRSRDVGNSVGIRTGAAWNRSRFSLQPALSAEHNLGIDGGEHPFTTVRAELVAAVEIGSGLTAMLGASAGRASRHVVAPETQGAASERSLLARLSWVVDPRPLDRRAVEPPGPARIRVAASDASDSDRLAALIPRLRRATLRAERDDEFRGEVSVEKRDSELIVTTLPAAPRVRKAISRFFSESELPASHAVFVYED